METAEADSDTEQVDVRGKRAEASSVTGASKPTKLNKSQLLDLSGLSAKVAAIRQSMKS